MLRTRRHVFALDGGVAVDLRGGAGEVQGRVLAAVVMFLNQNKRASMGALGGTDWMRMH